MLEIIQTEEWNIEEYPSHRFECDRIAQATVYLRLRGDKEYFINNTFKWKFLQQIEISLLGKRLVAYDAAEFAAHLVLGDWRTLLDPHVFQFSCSLFELSYPVARTFSITLTRGDECPVSSAASA